MIMGTAHVRVFISHTPNGEMNSLIRFGRPHYGKAMFRSNHRRLIIPGQLARDCNLAFEHSLLPTQLSHIGSSDTRKDRCANVAPFGVCHKWLGLAHGALLSIDNVRESFWGGRGRAHDG